MRGENQDVVCAEVFKAGLGAHAQPNQALEPTPNSFRSCVAPAIGRGSPRAFGFTAGQRLHCVDVDFHERAKNEGGSSE